MTIVTCDVS